ncbi:MBL fold metallo-hydrolase [Candidatus Saccharibacteria bacterium]|nr:MBL fold metallo-hydrolase [Candidatus Saccharibacteria bacterium]
MSDRIRNFENLELKFLGVSSGHSDSHTNAYFKPDPETLVFIDISMLNIEKARKLLGWNLKRVIVLITHLHPDHASGVVSLAYAVKSVNRSVILEVVLHKNIALEATRMFDAMGGRESPPFGSKVEKGMPVYRLYGLDSVGDSDDYCFGSNGCTTSSTYLPKRLKFRKIDCLKEIISTRHSEKLRGAYGFWLEINGKSVVYSGDTLFISPFITKLDSIAYNYGSEKEAELYLDISVRHSGLHLNWDYKTVDAITGMLRLMPNLKVILMHFDDNKGFAKKLLQERIENEIAEQFRDRIMLAQEEQFN